MGWRVGHEGQCSRVWSRAWGMKDIDNVVRYGVYERQCSRAWGGGWGMKDNVVEHGVEGGA